MVNDIISEVGNNFKKIDIEVIPRLIEILKKNPSFAELYNSCESVEAAVAEYNNAKYSEIIDYINSLSRKKNLHFGEIPFVFLLRGCISGGSNIGDLILPGNKTVDVKALDDGSNIKLENASIHGYKNLMFTKALRALTHILEKNENARNYLKSVITDDHKFEGRPASQDEKDYVCDFIDNLNEEEMGTTVFSGLELVGKRLNQVEVDAPINYAKLHIDGKVIIAKIENGPEVLREMESNKPRKVTLSRVTDTLEHITIPTLKQISYFTKAISCTTITAELLPMIHYTEGIVVVNKLGKDAFYVKKEEFFNYFVFNRLSKGIKLKVFI
jgi:hypothetical protein